METLSSYRVAVLSLLVAILLLVLAQLHQNTYAGAHVVLSTPTAAATPAGASAATRAAPVRAYHTQLAEQTSVVDIRRGELARMLGPSGASRPGARVVPAIAHGRPAGLVLFAVRSGGLCDVLGLQNGDNLRAVDGAAVIPDPGATSLVAALKSADGRRAPTFVDLDLRRRNHPARIIVLVHP